MSSPAEGRTGRPPTFTEQDVLKVLDYDTNTAEPMLTAGEIADGLADHFDIDVTGEAVRSRLGTMEDEGIVASKPFGASAIGWAALRAPRLSDETAATVEDRSDTDRDEFVPLDE
jgi:hypothetical protein